MLPPKQHFPVNWVDGMKISRQRFEELNNAIHDDIRDSIALRINSYNYGIVSSDIGLSSSLELMIQQKTIILNTCRAITPNGTRIEISRTNGYTKAVEASLVHLKVEEQQYDVILTADLYTRSPVGNQDPKETPARIPFSIPKYKLEFKPAATSFPEQFGNSLIIGKVQVDHSGVELFEDYIPPCTRISAFDGLKSYYEKYSQITENILKYACRIIQKVRAKKSKEELAIWIQFFSERVAYYLSDNLSYYRIYGVEREPVYLLIFLRGLAQTMKVALDATPDLGRDNMTKFFSEFLGARTKLGDFVFKLEEILSKVNYNHTDISETMLAPLDEFSEMVELLFRKLAEEEEYKWRKVETIRIQAEENYGHEITGQSGTNRRPRIRRR